MREAKPGRLKIGLVGAGKVGVVLAKALANAGHEIVAATGGSADSVERLETLLPGVPIKAADSVVACCDMAFFALPAKELEPLIRGLANRNVFRPGQLAVHTAPEFGPEIFAAAQAVIPLAISPCLVFTGTSLDLARLPESVMVATAAVPVQPIAQALIVEMGAEPVLIAPESRAAYAEAVSAAREMSAAIVKNTVAALQNIDAEPAARLASSVINSAVSEALRVYEPLDPDSALNDWVAGDS